MHYIAFRRASVDFAGVDSEHFLFFLGNKDSKAFPE